MQLANGARLAKGPRAPSEASKIQSGGGGASTLEGVTESVTAFLTAWTGFQGPISRAKTKTAIYIYIYRDIYKFISIYLYKKYK